MMGLLGILLVGPAFGQDLPDKGVTPPQVVDVIPKPKRVTPLSDEERRAVDNLELLMNMDLVQDLKVIQYLQVLQIEEMK